MEPLPFPTFKPRINTNPPSPQSQETADRSDSSTPGSGDVMQEYLDIWLNEPKVCSYNCKKYVNCSSNKFMYYTKDELEYLKGRPFKGTRRYDADILFRKIVDVCQRNGFKNMDGSPMISSEVKNDFYQMVYRCSSCSLRGTIPKSTFLPVNSPKTLKK